MLIEFDRLLSNNNSMELPLFAGRKLRGEEIIRMTRSKPEEELTYRSAAKQLRERGGHEKKH